MISTNHIPNNASYTNIHCLPTNHGKLWTVPLKCYGEEIKKRHYVREIYHSCLKPLYFKCLPNGNVSKFMLLRLYYKSWFHWSYGYSGCNATLYVHTTLKVHKLDTCADTLKLHLFITLKSTAPPHSEFLLVHQWLSVNGCTMQDLALKWPGISLHNMSLGFCNGWFQWWQHWQYWHCLFVFLIGKAKKEFAAACGFSVFKLDFRYA